MTLKERINNFNKSAAQEGWQMDVQLETNTPILEKGISYIDLKADMLLALCLNNGYYNRENVYRMLKFALAFSNRVQVFSTEGPARHNYRAFGKEEDEIVRVTRLARNRLHNQCMDGLNRINETLPPNEQRSVTFVEWEPVYADPAYQEEYEYLKKLYQENHQFKIEVDQTTTRVLSTRMGIENDGAVALDDGIEYVLEELAFLLAYPSLASTTKPTANHGASGFNYLYYEPWLVFENLMSGAYDGVLRQDRGFVIAKIDEL